MDNSTVIMLCICYSAAAEENTSLQGTILHISCDWSLTNHCFQRFSPRDEKPWRQTIVSALFCGVVPPKKNLREFIKMPQREAGGRGLLWAQSITHRSPFQTEFLLLPRRCIWYSLWRIYEAVLFNIKCHFCVATGAGSFSKVKRSQTELITDLYEWQPSVMGNPFLIGSVHLLLCRRLGITGVDFHKRWKLSVAY